MVTRFLTTTTFNTFQAIPGDDCCIMISGDNLHPRHSFVNPKRCDNMHTKTHQCNHGYNKYCMEKAWRYSAYTSYAEDFVLNKNHRTIQLLFIHVTQSGVNIVIAEELHVYELLELSTCLSEAKAYVMLIYHIMTIYFTTWREVFRNLNIMLWE